MIFVVNAAVKWYPINRVHPEKREGYARFVEGLFTMPVPQCTTRNIKIYWGVPRTVVISRISRRKEYLKKIYAALNAGINYSNIREHPTHVLSII
jgi:hypothetical protein